MANFKLIYEIKGTTGCVCKSAGRLRKTIV